MTIIITLECRPVFELTQMECCTSRPIVMTKSTYLLHLSSNVKVPSILTAEGEGSLLSMLVSWQILSRPELFLMKVSRSIIAPFQAVQRKRQRRLEVRDPVTWTKQLRTTCNFIPLRCKLWNVLAPRSQATVKTLTTIGVATHILRKAITHGTLAGICPSHLYRLSRRRNEWHISKKVNKNSM